MRHWLPLLFTEVVRDSSLLHSSCEGSRQLTPALSLAYLPTVRRRGGVALWLRQPCPIVDTMGSSRPRVLV